MLIALTTDFLCRRPFDSLKSYLDGVVEVLLCYVLCLSNFEMSLFSDVIDFFVRTRVYKPFPPRGNHSSLNSFAQSQEEKMKIKEEKKKIPKARLRSKKEDRARIEKLIKAFEHWHFEDIDVAKVEKARSRSTKIDQEMGEMTTAFVDWHFAKAGIARADVRKVDVAKPNHERSLTLMTLPREIRDLIWDKVLEGCKLWIGRYGRQCLDPERATVRRLISVEEPPLEVCYPDSFRQGRGFGPRVYPQHALEFVHTIIAQEFRQRWSRLFDDGRSLHLGELRLAPPAVFHGIIKLTLDMEQAIHMLEVTVPRISVLKLPFPPNTPLMLINAPNIKLLEINWHVRDLTKEGLQRYKNVPAEILLSRLMFFRRSFQTKVWLRIQVPGDDRQQLEAIFRLNKDFDSDQEEYFVVSRSGTSMDRRQFAFEIGSRTRYAGFFFPFFLRPGQMPRSSPFLDAVVEAHPWYDHVPLGGMLTIRGRRHWWWSLNMEEKVSIPTAQRRNSERPYDT